MANLSKDWQLKNARGILRVLANEIAPDKVQDLTLDDFIHLAICDLAELLNGSVYPDYGTLVAVTPNVTTHEIDLSSYKIDTITKLEDATNGLCIPVSPVEFEGLAAIPQKQKNVYWYRFGETIYQYIGTSAPSQSSTLNLFYNRTVTKATADTDYLDIRDKYVKLALDKAKILLYEQLKMTPPESLTNSVNANVAAIREANMSELGVVSGNNKPGQPFNK